MKHLTDIRNIFLDFFKQHDHKIVSSSSIIPENDPTLMFTNAGMVQFKDVFTGRERRPYNKAATSQKCIRAGGKHNDLDNVGYTARHHTFFEMLGNFSFADYFKEEAIFYAYQMVTKEFGIDPQKLCVTVYHNDDEAYNIWKKLTGFSDDKIIRISTNDNFWSMGDTGPCGPCSEIFYDHGEGIFGGPPGAKDADGDRFIEIWNLVFMQYEQLPSGERILLPNPSIDTGMGLERIAAVLQGVHNNYETDLFKMIIESIHDHIGETGDLHSYRVIADHLRACSFMVADGITPSNEGRGYVLRRIMRRAMRHGHLLGAKDPLMHHLVPSLVSLMGQAYPELVQAQSFIEQTFKNEEVKFRQTLDKGLRLLDDERTKIKNHVLPGDVAFKLYDTYGFPLDLTQDILRQEKVDVDIDGFNNAMKEQKDRARQAWAGSGDKANEKIYFDLKQEFGSTEFLGYATLHTEAVIEALILNGERVNELLEGATNVSIICQQTPFYAESGGQKGDIGYIETDQAKVIVTNTQKYVDGLFVHHGYVDHGTLSINQPIRLYVDPDHRKKVAANHTATHLLHAALRHVLGDHVVQKGSLVSDQRLRFDFVHHHPLKKDELKNVEHLVNQYILSNIKGDIRLMSPQEAIEEGAIALFGEKYGEEVRVVKFGDASVELCGGTHAKATGDIGLFKIISECSIASGIRRIEAITGWNVLESFDKISEDHDMLSHQLKENALNYEKRIADLKRQVLLLNMTDVDEQIRMDDALFSYKHLVDVDPSDLRPIAEHLLKKVEGVLILTTVIDKKISVVIACHDSSKINASDLIKKATVFLGGQGGGGKANFAQGGGLLIEKLPELLRFIVSVCSTQ